MYRRNTGKSTQKTCQSYQKAGQISTNISKSVTKIAEQHRVFSFVLTGNSNPESGSCLPHPTQPTCAPPNTKMPQAFTFPVNLFCDEWGGGGDTPIQCDTRTSQRFTPYRKNVKKCYSIFLTKNINNLEKHTNTPPHRKDLHQEVLRKGKISHTHVHTFPP